MNAVDEAAETVLQYEARELHRAIRQAECCGCPSCRANLRSWQQWIAGEPPGPQPSAISPSPTRTYTHPEE